MSNTVKKQSVDVTVKSYMAEYSKYVAQSRAIPSLIDGLKPVQRRSITSADDLHLNSSGRYLKAAKVEGQIIGDYSPHGGVSLSGLVQPFKIRYPLLEGQGNWGCPDDPGSVAASRYTEVRLTKFAEDFYLSSRKYSPTIPNYDGRLQEVLYYNPPVPGCLFTSANGIAIGLTTMVPTHEIGSVCDSYMRYLRGEEFLSGLYPDTCEDSIMISDEDTIKKLYETGEATVRYRAVVKHEKDRLIVTSFPPGFSRSKLRSSRILEYVDSGMLSLHNESSTDIRYVFTSKNPDILAEVEDLLESSVSYKMHLEYNGVISLYSLKSIYDKFTESRKEFIVTKYNILRDKLLSEIEYSKVLIKLRSNIKVFHDILDSDIGDDNVLDYMTETLRISEESARRILSTPVRSLMKKSIESLEVKIKEMEEKVGEYTSYINNPIDVMMKDAEELKRVYSGDRRCKKFTGKTSTSYIIKDGKVEVSDCGHAPVDSKYFFICDHEGFVVVTKDYFDSHGHSLHILRSDNPVGIIGFNDFSNVYVEYEDATIKIDEWSIRRRMSKIVSSESKSKRLVGLLDTTSL